MRGGFRYLRPRTLEEAYAFKRENPGSQFIAGGTDLLVQMKSGCTQPSALISLRSLPELQGIASNGTISIGSGARLTDIAHHPDVKALCPVLAGAARSVGSIQIRNVATLGGNLVNASPCANGAPPLLVLDALLGIHGETGRREVPIAELFTGPGETRLGPDEILTGIEITPPPAGTRSVFVKKGRVAVDLALASIAVVLEMEPDGTTCRRARVAAGAVAPTPVALPEVEALLTGETLSADVITRAGELAREGIAPISDIRASADYRRHIVGVLLTRAIKSLLPEVA